MYDPFWRKPDPLVPRRLRFELAERMAADGERASRPSTTARCARSPRELREAGVESVAVCLLHSYRFPAHEEQSSAPILREELPGVTVSLSSEILREQREYERSATTVVNAYVRPADGPLRRRHPARARRARASRRRSRSCSPRAA